MRHGLTDLAQQTIRRLLDQPADRDIINLGSPKAGLGKGQPSPMLTLESRYAWSCGMSVNTDVIDVCLMDFGGRVLAETNVQLQAIVFGGLIPPALAEMMIERTHLFGKPRYGVWRASPKLIVSEIKPDADAMGAAATPFKLAFF